MHSLTPLTLSLTTLLLVAGCSSNPVEAGRRALEQRAYTEAIVKLRPAVRADGASEAAQKLYAEAIKGCRAELRGPATKVETCDQAFQTLSAIEGFGAEGGQEATVLSQAVLCSARGRVRAKQNDEAIRFLVDAMDRHPGFSGGSPVLEKALEGPAEAAARAGKVREATALAQVLYGSGKQGLALSILDLLEASGAGAEAISKALRDRQARGKGSDAAAGLAAGWAAWHGHPDDAARWYDEIVRRVGKAAGASEVRTRSYAKARAEEATALADSDLSECQVVERLEIASKVSSIGAAAAAPVDGGALVAWLQGDKAPDQQVLVVRIGFDGTKGKAVTVADRALPPEPPAPDDPRGAFAPKNRETALALQPCKGVVEVAARGAPHAGWMRATLGTDGAVASPPARVPLLGESGRMPSEDVYWNIGCSNEQLVHVWLADTQLIRVAWFPDGAPEGDPTNVRLPGFAPWFEARSGEEGATLLTWVDILGEGASQIVWTTIPEDRTVALTEDESTVAAQPAVEGIDGRVEHFRLEPVGGRYALVWIAQGGDIGIRWIHADGRPLGQAAALVSMRSDARDVLIDAAGSGDRLGLVWTDHLTERWSSLHFATFGPDGRPTSRMQRIAGLVSPTNPPLLVGGEGNVYVVAWVDRSGAEGVGVTAATVRCGD